MEPTTHTLRIVDVEVRMILVSATPRFPEGARATMQAAGGLAALLASAADDDTSFTRERLAAITAETLVVAGDRDPLYPVELAVELYRGIPRAALYVVPGGGHSPVFLSEREAFIQRALLFLRHLSSGGRPSLVEP
jgi:pimeloyl-ACP methyl ester carboxylesterase